MPRSADPPALHELLSHSTWVWQLARRLVRDDQTADDVVQDAWIAALEHPPRSRGPGSLRGWLAAVTRNLALRRRSAEERRTRREHEVARPEEQPAADRVLEREEARRELVAMVLALDEPLRTPLLLRYFDELPPREIARRLGVPGSTLRGRLQRGVEVLRSRMQERRGPQWKDWCLALVPSGGMAATGTTSGAAALTGVLAMAVQWKLAVLAVALVGLSLVVWRPWAVVPVVTESPLPAVAANEAGPGVIEPREAESGRGAERRIVAGGNADANGVGPLGILVFGAIEAPGTVRDLSGTVTARNEWGDRHTAKFDDRAAYAMVGLDPGRWTLSLRGSGLQPRKEEVVLTAAEQEVRCDFRVEASTTLAVRFLTLEGEPHPLAVESEAPTQIVAVATEVAPGRFLARPARGAEFRYAVGDYVGGGLRPSDLQEAIPEGAHGLLEIVAPLPVSVSAVLGLAVLESTWVGPEDNEVEFRLPAGIFDELATTAHIRLLDATTSTPLSGIPILLHAVTMSGERTDDEGVARFPNVLPGRAWLEVSIGGPLRLTQVVEIPADGSGDLGTLRIAPPATIRGRLVDEKGRVVEGSVRWAPLDLLHHPESFRQTMSARAYADREFELPCAVRGRILVFPSLAPKEWAPQALVVDTSAGDVDGVTVTRCYGLPLTLHFETETEGRPVWMLHDENGVPIAMQNATSGPQRIRILPGIYRIAVYDGGVLVHDQEFEMTPDLRRLEVHVP